jgi:hypothetical protein
MMLSWKRNRAALARGERLCPHCDGDGVIEYEGWSEWDGYRGIERECEHCEGSGLESDEDREEREREEERALDEARCAAVWACPDCDEYGDAVPESCNGCGCRSRKCECGEIYNIEEHEKCPICGK